MHKALFTLTALICGTLSVAAQTAQNPTVIIGGGVNGSPAAKPFTTSEEVKPILELIKGQWAAVREFNGQDLLYFTTILAYRCGIQEIRFSYNGSAMQPWEAEPCWHDLAQPNTLKVETHLPYAVAPLGSLQTIDVELLFDDGTTSRASYQRSDIQIN